MSKQIPEIIDLDAQRLKLIATFGGNMDFGNVRGKCNGEFLSVATTMMTAEDVSAKAPSAGVGNLKYFLTSFANVRGKIAQLERDGFALAVHEANEALKYADYRMLGEIHPFEETVPVTLAMFNPEVTLQVLARTHTAKPYWCSIDDIPKGLHVPSYRRSIGGIVFYNDLLKSLEELNKPMSEKLKGTPGKHIHHRSLAESVLLPNVLEEQGTKICHGLGCICYAEKSKILRRFTKKEQRQIAVWQFNLPKAYAGMEEHHFYVGLHLEAEHNYWLNKRHPFCSTNTFHGYGAIAYPGEAYHCFDKRSERFKGTRILLCN